MFKRLAFIAAAAVLPLSASHAAEPYPSKPVTLVVPFAPGGGTDVVARLIAQGLTELWKQSVVVDNRPGANTMTGTEFVARAKPDGYTLLMASPSHTINPSLYKNIIRFDTEKDFKGAALVATGPLFVAVPANLPVKNFAEFMALARSHPGAVNYGSAGTGSSPHLAGELLESKSGVAITHVPYKGTAPSITDLIAGRIQATFSPLPGVKPHVQSGKLRLLATTGEKRFASYPDLPTIAESGVPGYSVTQWWGIVTPSGTPPEIIKAINDAVGTVLKQPKAAEQLADQGALPAPTSSAKFDAMIHDEISMWRKVVETAGVKPD